MTSTSDVVVAGAGHNGLITAAYLARSGRDVTVLDAAPVPGGGATTEELFGPGYAVDRSSTGHTLIRANPLLVDDELGLVRDHGLTYVDPDPVASLVFPDGERFRMWLDLDATTEELARFSRRDADTYRRLLREHAAVAPVLHQASHEPIGWGPSLDQRLAALPDGGIWQRRAGLSAWDLVRHEFSSEHVQAFLAWQASQTLVSIDLPGSGLLPTGLLAGRHRRSWSIPRGGSGSLTDALVAVIEDAGGAVLTGRRVTRLLLDRGRCAGVETSDGERFLAREAVVSSLHVRHLVEMAPEDAWDPSYLYGARTLHPGIPLFVVHLLMSEVPRFADDAASDVAVASGLAGWPQDVIDLLRAIRDDRPDRARGFPSVLVATPTIVDPDRAPDGRHTVKVLAPAPARPSTDPSVPWSVAKDDHADRLLEEVGSVMPNVRGDAVVARLVHSPEDIEAANAHMLGGAPHGGDRVTPFTGAQRPAPGWADHRTPIAGLYQTGGTTHPGGSITGIPGRNAAQVVLRDLGTSLPEVVAGGAGRGGRT